MKPLDNKERFLFFVNSKKVCISLSPFSQLFAPLILISSHQWSALIVWYDAHRKSVIIEPYSNAITHILGTRYSFNNPQTIQQKAKSIIIASTIKLARLPPFDLVMRNSSKLLVKWKWARHTSFSLQ